ncbi:MAG: hypothetical protein Q9204_003035 [Flavoplaca sp. TL-2023a]
MDSSPEPQDKSPVGNYMIFHCENLDRSAGFPELFARVRETIELVLLDLQHGIDSPHGYRAFFKSNKHLPIVQSVFQNITAGRNLRGRRPLINCLHPYGEAVTRPSAYSAICEPREGHELVRARALQSGFLILCPEFFRYPAFANGTEDCPVIAGRRGFQKFAEEENGSALTDTQFGTLIRELVRSYNPLDKGPKEGGINGAKECFELNGEQSIQNAGNWVLYAAYFRPQTDWDLNRGNTSIGYERF